MISKFAHDPGVGSLIRVQVYQYLLYYKLSFHAQLFLSVCFFFNLSPNQWVMRNFGFIFLVKYMLSAGSGFGAGLSVFEILFTKKPKNPV